MVAAARRRAGQWRRAHRLAVLGEVPRPARRLCLASYMLFLALQAPLLLLLPPHTFTSLQKPSAVFSASMRMSAWLASLARPSSMASAESRRPAPGHLLMAPSGSHQAKHRARVRNGLSELSSSGVWRVQAMARNCGLHAKRSG
ncbi:hypothetical protein ABPG75_011000 [Micractinium tetrahymenae]